MVQVKIKFNFSVLWLLIGIFFITTVIDADAQRRRRSYNPERTKQQAIDIIRTHSEEVSNLAGLQPASPESDSSHCTLFLEEDSELLTEEFSSEDEDSLIGEYGEDLDELALEDDIAVDYNEFKKLWIMFADDGEEYSTMVSGIKKSDLMDEIMDWLGTPYRFGGNTRKAVDCSAFIQHIFAEIAEVRFPRTAREQVNLGYKVERKDMEFGDLVFFHTYSRRFASHVGIYLGDDLFVHASSRYGVTVSSLENTYYKTRFISGRRIVTDDLYKFAINKEDYEASQTTKH